MATRTIRQSFKVDGVLTDVTSAILADPTNAYGVKRDDTGAVVVAAGTVMTHLGTGEYSYSFTDPGVTMTGFVKFTYGASVYYFEQDLPAHPTVTVGVGCNFTSLVNDIARDVFGLRPTASDVISDGVTSTDQATDILRAISKGLRFVYSAHTWRFLKPRVTITTNPSYSTGTITVDANGNVTGVGTVFPAYSASAHGILTIPSVGSFAVATYVGATGLTLSAYTGGAITTATTYTLGFNTYPMPAGMEDIEGRLSYPENFNQTEIPLRKISEEQIRVLLMQDNTPSRPDRYADIMDTFDATAGSSRSVVLYPVPDASYVLTAIGVAKWTMIDAVNQYPLGGNLLAPVITEACLAAAERDIQRIDEGHPDAVHSRALVPLLAMAIQQDKERGAPETLGVDHGSESQEPELELIAPSRKIWWDAGGGIIGYI